MAIVAKGVDTELARLEDHPPSEDENKVARRALMRYGKSDDVIAASEDWVRLFIAIRRTGGAHTRITPTMLKQWKTKVKSSTTVMRTCYLVGVKALEALPSFPPDLDRWVIPKDSIDLPADIYTDDMLIIDDGYDRSKLNVPGVVHIECAAKWSQERAPVDPGRSSGSHSTTPAAPAATKDLLSTPHPVPIAPHWTPAPSSGDCAARAPSPIALGTAPPAPLPPSSDTPEAAMQDIITNTMKAVQAQRWYCADSSQPTTVEFWLRLFLVHMQRNAKTAEDWTDTQRAFVKYITREALTSQHLAVLSPIIPSLRELEKLAPDHFPALATALCKLASIDFTAAPAAPESEKSFHNWLQAELPLAQVQFLYNGALYQGFLATTFEKYFEKANQADADERSHLIALLLESVGAGTPEHMSLTFAKALACPETATRKKIRLLWSTPGAPALVADWHMATEWGRYLPFAQQAGADDWAHENVDAFMAAFEGLRSAQVPCKDIPNAVLQPLYGEFMSLSGVGSTFLRSCFKEQLQVRVLRSTPAAPAASEDVIDVDPEGDPAAWATAKELQKSWQASVGKKPECARLAALTAKIASVREAVAAAKKAKQGKETQAQESGEQDAKPAAENQAQAEACTAASAADTAASAADGPAEAADPKCDMDSNPLLVGDIVTCYAQKNKDKYNERTAKVTGLISRAAKVTMLDGPAKGEKRKVAYNTIKVKSKEPPAKKLFAQFGGASSAAAAPEAPKASAEPGAAAVAVATLPTAADPTAPDAACLEMFGNLTMMQ